jgi:hypothetical protein
MDENSEDGVSSDEKSESNVMGDKEDYVEATSSRKRNKRDETKKVLAH